MNGSINRCCGLTLALQNSVQGADAGEPSRAVCTCEYAGLPVTVSAVTCNVARMKLILGALLIGASLLLYRFKPVAGHGDLQGRWTVVSAPSGWKIVPGMDVLVKESEIQIRLGPVVTSKMSYRADAAENTIDASDPGGEVGRGIYRLDGDLLTLCVGAPGKDRPDTPDSENEGAIRWVLKKAPAL